MGSANRKLSIICRIELISSKARASCFEFLREVDAEVYDDDGDINVWLKIKDMGVIDALNDQPWVDSVTIPEK